MSGTRDAALTKYLEEKGYEVCDYNNSCSFLVIPSKAIVPFSQEIKKYIQALLFRILLLYMYLKMLKHLKEMLIQCVSGLMKRLNLKKMY